MRASRHFASNGCALNKTSNKQKQRTMQSLVKSKQRVADHGEVFTPAWMVVGFHVTFEPPWPAFFIERAWRAGVQHLSD
jgi:hypothetical protein